MKDKFNKNLTDSFFFQSISRYIKKLSISTKIIIGFALPVLLMSIISTVIYFNTNSLVDTAKWVQHTQKVITKGHLLEKLILDMETGERGFLITGDEQFLQPYYQGKKNFKQHISVLKSLVLNAPSADKVLSLIEKSEHLASKWLEKATQPEIDIRRIQFSGRSKAEVEIFHQLEIILSRGIGRNILDEIRDTLNKLNNIYLSSENESAQILVLLLEKAMVDQENGQRGFLITGKEQFLTPFHTGRDNFNKNIIALKNIAKNAYDMNEILEKISSIEIALSEWQVKVAEVEIETRRKINESGLSPMEFLQRMVVKGTESDILSVNKSLIERIEKRFNLPNQREGIVITLNLDKSFNEQVANFLRFMVIGEEKQRDVFNRGRKIVAVQLEELSVFVKKFYSADDISEMEKDIESLKYNIHQWYQTDIEPMLYARKNIEQSRSSTLARIQHVLKQNTGKVILDEARILLEKINHDFTKARNDKGPNLVLQIGKYLIDQESSELGFIITGDESFLKPYNKGIKNRRRSISELMNIAVQAFDVENTLDQISLIETEINKWLSTTAEPQIALREQVNAGKENYITLKKTLGDELGKGILDNIKYLEDKLNQTFRSVLFHQLEHWGARVQEAADGRATLMLLQKRDNSGMSLFDLVFINADLPDMSGIQLAKKIKSIPEFKPVKLVMMTSMAHRGDLQYFSELGFSAYFSKPVITTDLFNALALTVDNPETAEETFPLMTHHNIKSLEHDNTVENDRNEKMILNQASNLIWPDNIHLMVVEDIPINQELLEFMLEEIGLSADFASDGKEALKMLAMATEDKPYTLILMDCQMPIMDGYTATRNIRLGAATEVYKNIPIIALTANVMSGDKEKCLGAGMSDYLSKPIEIDELEEMLKKWIIVESEREITDLNKRSI